ncbi:MAG: S41 family peptidase [Flavobacterium sp.]|nr:S41 family peptidase [Flavobacterium sp.]
MKTTVLFFAILWSVTNIAQSKLDTLTYQKYQNKRFTKVTFDTGFNDSLIVNTLSLEEKIEALSTVWHEAKFNFANFDLIPNVNWDSLYRAYLPKIMATNHIMETYGVLMQFNQHLRDGHTRILPPLYHFRKEKFNVVPIHFKYIDGKAVVYQIKSNDPSFKEIQKGMILEKIDGIPVQQYIQKNISPTLHFSTVQDSIGRIYHYELLTGAENSKVVLDFKTANGKTLQKTLSRKPFEWKSNTPVSYSVLPGNIGHLVIDSFVDEVTFTAFKEYFPAITKTAGLIIDIRHNGGGNSHWGHEIIGYLTAQPFYPSMTLMNEYHPVHRAWGGDAIQAKKIAYDWKPYQNEVYTKPIVVLISELTYSASEDFCAAFITTKRGILMGTATGGSTGQPLGYTLPGGGIGFICSKRDAMYDGTEFVGLGIQPDIEVKPSIEGLQKGKDEVLEAALNYLKKNKTISK